MMTKEEHRADAVMDSICDLIEREGPEVIAYIVSALVKIAKETEGAVYLKSMFAVGMSALAFHIEKEGKRPQ